MPIQQIALSDTEKQIVQEVQARLGLNSIEETMEWLAKQRIQEMLAKLAGQEVKRKRY